jgi:hypothetical protein
MKEISVINLDKSKLHALEESTMLGAFGSPGGLVRAYAYAKNQFSQMLGGSPIARLENEDDMAKEYNRLTDKELAELIRIRKVNKGFLVYMPSFSVPSIMDIYPEFFNINANQLKAQIEAKIPGVWNLESPVDINIGNLAAGLEKVFATLPDADPEIGHDCEIAIRGFRLIGAPGVKAFNDRMGEGQLEVLKKTLPDNGYSRSLVVTAWSARIWHAFAEYFISDVMAEYITQEEGDGIKYNQLVEYVSRLQADVFKKNGNGESSYSPHIVAVSKIASDNEQTGIILQPQTNDQDLSVTNKGIITWIPRESISPEFVEAAIEEGGMQPDGDWTRQDTVDPESNEYVTDTSRDGRQVRKLKPRGQNMLMYVDWHNGKMAYTGENASVRIRDISMFRPVQANQILAYLKASLVDTASISTQVSKAFAFAKDHGKRLGFKLPSGPEYSDPYTSIEDMGNARQKFENKDVWGSMAIAIDALNQAYSNRRSPNEERDLTPEEYQTLHGWVEQHQSHPTMTLLSKTSPSGVLRAIFEYYSKVLVEVEKNPDAAFGSLSVPSMLDTIGTLKVLIHYGSNLHEVEAKDLEERKAYINPDLDPIDDIEMPNIPYVSGSVELMPHQVKVWNYLKNKPKNAVFSVDAGGGKTLLGLMYAAYLIGEGLVKRPLVLCPQNLVSNYINDAVWIFAGKMNVVNISSAALQDKRWGEEKLIELCKGAPVNTIFVTDYDFIAPKGNSTRLVNFTYGNTDVKISLNAEFLKRVPWDMCIMDESHFLKTRNGNRNREVMRLISSIPYKVQMSGTYISDSLTDVVGEYGLIDPQAFGDTAAFAERYFDEGNIRNAPIPMAQKLIRDKMAETSSFISVSRKEWAALLPRRQDVFYPVEMTEAQKLVYLAILKETRAEFDIALNENPILRNSFKTGARDADADEQEEDSDDNLDDLLDGPLNFYLARLEGFLTAPTADPLGKSLTGKDSISPKTLKTISIIKQHLNSGTVGKIIVWTQYVNSATAVYEALPADLQEQAIHYVSANGDELLAQFVSNPKKKILVGCEKSINTGHNLQVVSRIIRLETVWNYGTLEQGESRMNRPTMNDPRMEENGGHGIHFDWVFVDRSIDVTKNSRMFSKLIATVKFYNSNSPEYMNLEAPPPLRLTKKNIFNINDWQDPEGGCREFFQAYEQYQQIQEREYATFRDSPQCRKEGYTMPTGKVLPDSGFLMKMPYTPRMQLYGAESLGLVPFLEYVSTNKRAKNAPIMWDDPNWSPEGLSVHTAYGDCIAKDYNSVSGGKPNTIRVTTPDGSTASVPLAACWVITKPSISGLDVRSMIAKKVGAKDTPVVPKEVDVGRKTGKTNKRLPEKDPEGKLGGFELFVMSYDNYPGLAVDAENENVVAAEKQLKAYGFLPAQKYYDARVLSPKALGAWIAAVEKKVKIEPKYRKRLMADLELWTEHKDIQKFLQALSKGQRTNFNLEQIKAAPAGVIKPYLYIVGQKQSSVVNICLNARVNAASLSKVKSVAVPGVKWTGPWGGELQAFFKSKQDMQTALKKMFAEFDIENKKEVLADFNNLRVTNTTKK